MQVLRERKETAQQGPDGQKNEKGWGGLPVAHTLNPRNSSRRKGGMEFQAYLDWVGDPGSE